MWITLGMFLIKKAVVPLLIIAVILFLVVKLKGGCRPNKTLRGTALAVHDGDTITFRARLKRRTVHLKGVDCPELGQPYGPEAKVYTERMLGMDKRRLRRPRCRLVLTRKDQKWAVVYGPEGWDLGRELVRYGLAWAVDKGYNDLERAARKAKRGLWADRRPIPPWEWVEKAGPFMDHLAGCDQCWESFYEYQKRQIGLCVVGFRLMQGELKGEAK